MKLMLKEGHLRLASTDEPVGETMKVRLETDLDKREHKFHYSIDKRPFKEFKEVFEIPAEFFNKKVTVRLKTAHRKTRKTKTYVTDPTHLYVYGTLEAPLNMELPESFKKGLEELRAARKEFEQLKKKQDKLARAVVELGRKGELL